VIEPVAHALAGRLQRVEAVVIELQGTTEHVAIDVDDGLDVVGVDARGKLGRADQPDLFGTEADEPHSRVELLFAGREALATSTIVAVPAPLSIAPLREVVGVDVAGDDEVLVGVGTEVGDRVPARRVGRLAVDCDGEVLALASAREARAGLLRDADRRDIADRRIRGADAPGRRQRPLDVVREDEGGGTRLHRVVVLFAAVDEPVDRVGVSDETITTFPVRSSSKSSGTPYPRSTNSPVASPLGLRGSAMQAFCPLATTSSSRRISLSPRSQP